MRRDGKTGVRLRKPLFLNGFKKEAGSVVVVKPGTAQALIRQGIAKQNKNK